MLTGTANCSGGNVSAPVSAEDIFTISGSRLDNATLPTNNNYLDLDFLTGREVATIKDAMSGSELYSNNYSVIPLPLYESDGAYVPCHYDASWNCDTTDLSGHSNFRHYLVTIVGAKMNKDNPGSFTSRQNVVSPCGLTGNIEARISDCKTVNGDWAFYNGAQYGQAGEGNWSLVSVLDDSGTKYEVWRDERTKLIWSDKTNSNYNWYRASGYSKPSAVSKRETQHSSEPGELENSAPYNVNQILQPSNPISVCPDVTGSPGAGEITAGGGHYTNYNPNPETAFKANLNYSHHIIWKLPSMDDYKLADVNGIRKVLPKMNYLFWTSTSRSDNRADVWQFKGDFGDIQYNSRHNNGAVRCVGFEFD